VSRYVQSKLFQKTKAKPRQKPNPPEPGEDAKYRIEDLKTRRILYPDNLKGRCGATIETPDGVVYEVEPYQSKKYMVDKRVFDSIREVKVAICTGWISETGIGHTDRLGTFDCVDAAALLTLLLWDADAWDSLAPEFQQEVKRTLDLKGYLKQDPKKSATVPERYDIYTADREYNRVRALREGEK
jgi:hypothetical protein